jgi:hypothetical protein
MLFPNSHPGFSLRSHATLPELARFDIVAMTELATRLENIARGTKVAIGLAAGAQLRASAVSHEAIYEATSRLALPGDRKPHISVAYAAHGVRRTSDDKAPRY